jgi:hypothetical protein
VRGRWVWVAAAAAVALGACSTDRELTEPEPEPVTAERLAAAAITLADLPEGFTQSEGGSMGKDVVAEHDCDDALADLAPELEEGATFTSDDATLSASVASVPGQGPAVDQLLIDVADACSGVVVADAGVSVRTGPLDFGVLSDDTIPARFEVERTTGPIAEHDLVLIRRGDLVHLIRLDGPRPSDKALLDQVVRVAINRLGLLHDETT